MNRNQFIRAVYNKYNTDNDNPFIGLAMINDVLNSMVEVMIDALVKDGKLKIKDVISIAVNSSTGERNGYNAYTKKAFTYMPKKRISVKFGKAIRNKINDSAVD